MNRETVEKIFVIAVFAIAYVVIAKGVTLTGFAIHMPEFSPDKTVPDETNYAIALDEGINLELKGVDEGSKIRIKQGTDTYSISVLHLVQDYDSGEEYVNMLASPGDKRIRLKEGELSLVDFNNDGKEDAIISVVSISHGEAAIKFVSP